MTISKKTLNKIYNGLNNANDPTSDIRLTLGSIRTIQINVMGEVVQPGTYSLSFCYSLPCTLPCGWSQ